ncbi:hypothetical protein R1sor_023226 [Riccia sorocarpa]|uniref:Fe2OG dioxygenase domain-containing protein n=1 Tax=Riccia sorocarpa TaxID=122646 RepID=A0ABD3GQ97_9MARC
MTVIATQRRMNDDNHKIKSIKAMADTGITHIPPDFILPLYMQPRFTKTDISRDVPTVDLSLVNDPCERKRIATSIVEAVRDWGYFKVRGHGISEILMTKLLLVIREFFDLPLSEKVQFLGSQSDTSSPRYGRTRRGTTGHQSWRDQFHHRIPPLNPKELQTWPDKPEAYRETVLGWTKEIQKLSNVLFDLLAEGYSLEPRYFQSLMGAVEKSAELDATLLAAYYPRCPQADLASGIVAHTDPTSMVLALQDSPGLEVFKDGTWIPVGADPACLTISTGDVMEILTNGSCKSCEHRVRVKETQDRVSALVMLKPRLDIKLEAAPVFITKGQATRFMDTDMTYRQYVTSFKDECPEVSFD